MIEKIIEFLTDRTRAYRLTFNPEKREAKAVLEDLAKFCRANESCFSQDPRAHAVLEGRREVWLRIQNHIHLSPEELLKLHNGGKNK